MFTVVLLLNIVGFLVNLTDLSLLRDKKAR